MKKSKELLLFITFLVIPIALPLVYGVCVNWFSDTPRFMGFENYIRMFLNDKLFIKALLNTYFKPIIVSFIFVSIFALIVFLIRKRSKMPRLVFYLCIVIIGGTASLVYKIYTNIALLGVLTDDVYDAQAIISSHIGVSYTPYILDSISFTNVMLYLHIGVLTAFIFWLGELIYNKLKAIKKQIN